MYEVGISADFTAWHVMPGMAGPEGELHSHNYRLEAILTREALDERGMVCDLDVLEACLKGAIAEVDDRDLEVIRPPDAEAVTVEILSAWAHGHIADALGPLPARLAVRVWESPVAYGGYAEDLPRASS